VSVQQRKALSRGELTGLDQLLQSLGMPKRFAGDAKLEGDDLLIRSPHRLVEAVGTAQLLIGSVASASWQEGFRVLNICKFTSLMVRLILASFGPREDDELPFFFHLIQPGAHIWLVLLVEMSEEHAAADLLVFQPEDAPQILELILRKGIEGLYQLQEDFSRIAEDICQRTIAIGLVNPGIDFIDFPQFWRPGR
jgi:hypothetical protein